MHLRTFLKIVDRVVLLTLVIVIISTVLYLTLSSRCLLLIVRSTSMEPAIKMGDIIVLKAYKQGTELKKGQVISFNTNGMSVTHRLVGIRGSRLITRGDAVEAPDPWPLYTSQVKGTYLFRIPYMGYVAKFLRGRGGSVLLVSAGCILLIGVVIQLLRNRERKMTAQRQDAGTYTTW